MTDAAVDTAEPGSLWKSASEDCGRGQWGQLSCGMGHPAGTQNHHPEDNPENTGWCVCVASMIQSVHGEVTDRDGTHQTVAIRRDGTSMKGWGVAGTPRPGQTQV